MFNIMLTYVELCMNVVWIMLTYVDIMLTTGKRLWYNIDTMLECLGIVSDVSWISINFGLMSKYYDIF